VVIADGPMAASSLSPGILDVEYRHEEGVRREVGT
jgi:hypothetical protein